MADGDLATRIRTLVDTTDPVTVNEVSRTRRRAHAAPRALAVTGIAAVIVAAAIVAVVQHRSATSTVITSGGPAAPGASSSVTRGPLTVTLRLEQTVVPAGRYLAVLTLGASAYPIPVPHDIPVRVVSTGMLTTRLVVAHDFVHAGDLDPATLVVDNRTGRTLDLGCRGQDVDYSVVSDALSAGPAPVPGGGDSLSTCVRRFPPGPTQVPVTIITTRIACTPPGPASSAGCRSQHVPVLSPGPFYVTITTLVGFPAGISLPAQVPITVRP